jgi:hypothetical protein
LPDKEFALFGRARVGKAVGMRRNCAGEGCRYKGHRQKRLHDRLLIACGRNDRDGEMLTGESDDLKCRLAVAAMPAGYLAKLILIWSPSAIAL